MTLIMIVAVTTITNTREKQAFYSGIEGSSAAYLAAQSAVEVGILEVKNNLIGYETGGQVENAFTSDPNLDGTPEAYGNYTIVANGKEGSGGEFYLPIFGTGTAAPREDCSVLDYIDPEDGEIRDDITISDDDLDNPCNWNKLLYGDSVTIPLYTSDSGGLVFPGDSGFGFTGWDLKVRTPCEDSAVVPYDPDCSRYVLDVSDGDVEGGASIVKWELVQEFEDGSSESLGVNDEKKSSGGGGGGHDTETYVRDLALNTEIYASFINDEALSKGYIVLSTDPAAPVDDHDAYADIYERCIELVNPTSGSKLKSLTLTLQIVSSIDAPYLEWQLVDSSNQSFADGKSVIVGEGYYKNGSSTYYSPYVVNRSTTGESVNVYTLSN